MIFKKYFLLFTVVYLFLSYTQVFAAEITGADAQKYKESGVSKQIKDYLCAPTDTSKETGSETGYFGTDTSKSGTNNVAQNDLYLCINKLYKFAIVLGASIGVFFLVIAGYIYIGSDGNQESVDKAKDMLVSTITAMVILFAGYILLKAINPDLIQFKQIQPGSLVDLTKFSTSTDFRLPMETPSGEPSTPVAAGTTSLPNKANGTIAQLQAAGCDITNEARPRDELPNLTQGTWDKLLQICQISSSSGTRPKVSSTVRRESTGSYHQKGCAVDFADGNGNGFFDIKTKTGRASGIAIFNAAKQAGISESRINPGSDRDQSYHIHIDIGTTCPN